LGASSCLFDLASSDSSSASSRSLSETSSLGDESAEVSKDQPSSSSTTELPSVLTPEQPLRPNIPRPPLSDSSLHKRSVSMDGNRRDSGDSMRIAELEREMAFLRAKLTRKDKVVSELQRQVTQSETSLCKTEQKLSSYEEEVKGTKAEKDKIEQKLRRAEKRITSHDATVKTIRDEHAAQVSALENDKAKQSDKITQLEKAVRTLQNEKAVLSAAVEARESKLSKMSEKLVALDELSQKVGEQEKLRGDLEEADRRYKKVCATLEKTSQSEKDCRSELKQTQAKVTGLNEQLETEKASTASRQSELETQQLMIQKIKAERNSYKQKGDSLAKEIAKVCRSGRTIREVEKIIADDAARREEVALLRKQKQKALEELEHYRTAFEQSRAAQKMAGMDHDSAKLLERNAELQRLLTELTEYLNAKEMQLETLKQVNEALQSEIRTLAKANMSNWDKNDI